MDWGPSSCDLCWAPPETDGGAEITHYHIEMLEKELSCWESGLKINVEDVRISQGQMYAACPGLTEGFTYKFRVKAYNVGGPSLPSPPSEPFITAINRSGTYPSILQNVFLRYNQKHIGITSRF